MEIEKRIVDLQENIYRKYIFERKVNELNEFYNYLRDRLRDITYKLESMDIDISDLNKKSIIFLWYELFTNKGKTVTKMEYDYKLSKNLIDYINKELNDLKNKLEKISDYEIELKNLLEEKAQLSIENEPKTTIDENTIKYKNRIRDINEALNSSQYLSQSLNQLIALLNKTKDWDNIDIVGRSLFMSLTKTTLFKQTDDKINRSYYFTNKLIRDIKVINFYMDIDIDISRVISLLDYFENKLFEDVKDKSRFPYIIDYIRQGYEIMNDIIDTLQKTKSEYLKLLLEKDT